MTSETPTTTVTPSPYVAPGYRNMEEYCRTIWQIPYNNLSHAQEEHLKAAWNDFLDLNQDHPAAIARANARGAA